MVPMTARARRAGARRAHPTRSAGRSARPRAIPARSPRSAQSTPTTMMISGKRLDPPNHDAEEGDQQRDADDAGDQDHHHGFLPFLLRDRSALRSSPPGCVRASRLEGFDKPAGGAQEPGIVAAPADQLHADRQPGLRLQQRQRHGRHAEIGPGRAEHRVAGAVEAARRLAGRRRREDGVEFIEHAVQGLVERRRWRRPRAV